MLRCNLLQDTHTHQPTYGQAGSILIWNISVFWARALVQTASFNVYRTTWEKNTIHNNHELTTSTLKGRGPNKNRFQNNIDPGGCVYMYLNKTYVMQHFAKARSPCCVATCSKTHTHQPTYGHCVYMYLNKTAWQKKGRSFCLYCFLHTRTRPRCRNCSFVLCFTHHVAETVVLYCFLHTRTRPCSKNYRFHIWNL